MTLFHSQTQRHNNKKMYNCHMHFNHVTNTRISVLTTYAQKTSLNTLSDVHYTIIDFNEVDTGKSDNSPRPLGRGKTSLLRVDK